MTRKGLLAALATALFAVVAATVPPALASDSAQASSRTSSGSGTVDWPQFHNTVDRAGSNSAEAVLNTTNVTGLALKWRTFLNSTGAYSGSSPAVVGGTVYVGSDDDGVYAVNANTGAQLWK